MRNFKKLIAMGTALAMAIIMNVSAFAAAGDTAEEPITDAYADGAVVVSAIKAALPTMVSGSQYTVVVVPVGEEISDSNIHYINQADGADAIWATTTTWGTPAALADGTYVVRVGDEAGNVDETYFRIGSTEEPPAGDPVPVVTFMNGATTFATVDTVDGKATLPSTNPTLAPVEGYATTAYTFVEWVTVATVDGKEVLTPFTADTVVEADTTVYPKFKSNYVVGDTTGDAKIRAKDRGQINSYIKQDYANAGKALSPVSHLLDSSKCVIGDTTGDGKIRAKDRGQVNSYIKQDYANAGTAGNAYYVINK